MKVRTYRLAARAGEARELRVARVNDVTFFAIHQLAKCLTGPLGVTAADLPTLAKAVADAAADVADGKEPRP